jgi:hypothetical protein
MTVIQGPWSDDRALLTKKQLATYVRKSTRWVEGEVAKGMPHVRVGSTPRFSPGEVLAWLADKYGSNRWEPRPDDAKREREPR